MDQSRVNMMLGNPMAGSIPTPMPPQPCFGVSAFSGPPPPPFNPINNLHMRPLTPEQFQVHTMAAMQQRAVELQQLQQQMVMRRQEEINQLVQQYTRGGQISMSTEQFDHICNMMQGLKNMIPGREGPVPPLWMQPRAHQPETMMNPVPQPALDEPPHLEGYTVYNLP